VNKDFHRRKALIRLVYYVIPHDGSKRANVNVTDFDTCDDPEMA